MVKIRSISLKYFLLSALIVISLFIASVMALHIVRTSSNGLSFYVNEDTVFTYNISINNSDVDAVLEITNITQVNITLPSGFTFGANSSGTDVSATLFNHTGSILSWTNASEAMIFTNNTRSFWFNATASTPGCYNFTIITLNDTGIRMTYANISIIVNDTTKPSMVQFVAPTFNNGVNNTAVSIAVNITFVDNGAVDKVVINLYNSTALRNSTWADISGVAAGTTSSLFANFTGLPDETYYYNSTVNDTRMFNDSVTYRITIDSTTPVPAYGTGVQANATSVHATAIYVNVSVTETNEQNITFTLSNATAIVNSTTFASTTTKTRAINWTGLPNTNVTYTYNVTVRDIATHVNNTETRIIELLDGAAPVVGLSCTPATISVGGTISCTCSATDNFDSDPTISYTANPSTSTIGDFTTTCTSTDDSGNVGSSTFSYTIIAAQSGGTSSSSSSSSSLPGKVTYVATSDEFSNGYKKEIAPNERVQVKVQNSNHYVSLISTSVTSATIEIASTPITTALSINETKKFDSNTDGYYDISVTLVRILNGKATLLVKSINEIAPVAVTPATLTQTTEEPAQQIVPQVATDETTEVSDDLPIKTIIIVVIAIIIIIAIIWLILIKSKKRK